MANNRWNMFPEKRLTNIFLLCICYMPGTVLGFARMILLIFSILLRSREGWSPFCRGETEAGDATIICSSPDLSPGLLLSVSVLVTWFSTGMRKAAAFSDSQRSISSSIKKWADLQCKRGKFWVFLSHGLTKLWVKIIRCKRGRGKPRGSREGKRFRITSEASQEEWKTLVNR